MTSLMLHGKSKHGRKLMEELVGDSNVLGLGQAKELKGVLNETTFSMNLTSSTFIPRRI